MFDLLHQLNIERNARRDIQTKKRHVLCASLPLQYTIQETQVKIPMSESGASKIVRIAAGPRAAGALPRPTRRGWSAAELHGEMTFARCSTVRAGCKEEMGSTNNQIQESGSQVLHQG